MSQSPSNETSMVSLVSPPIPSYYRSRARSQSDVFDRISGPQVASDESDSASTDDKYSGSRNYEDSISSEGKNQDLDAEESSAEITDGGWACCVRYMISMKDFKGHRIYVRGRRHAPEQLDDPNQLSDDMTDMAKNLETPTDETRTEIPTSRKSSRNTRPKPILLLTEVVAKQNRYDYDNEDLKAGYVLDIRSPLLISLLSQTVLFYPQTVLQGSKISVRAPFQVLWHHHKALQAFLENGQNDESTRKHVQVLLEFLYQFDPSLTNEIRRFDECGLGEENIQYSNAWYAFKPGTLILIKDSLGSYPVAKVITEVEVPERKTTSDGRPYHSEMIIKCQHVISDGQSFSFASSREVVDPFDGFSRVSDLRCAPLSRLRAAKVMTEQLLRHGEMFCDLQGQHMREYIGGARDNLGEESHRVMIDWDTYARKRGQAAVSLEKYDDSGKDVEKWSRAATAGQANSSVAKVMPPSLEAGTRNATSQSILGTAVTSGQIPRPLITSEQADLPGPNYSEREAILAYLEVRKNLQGENSESDLQQEYIPNGLFFLLIDTHVWGFSFRDKTWSQYHVGDLATVNFKKKSFSRLVLDEQYKTVLKAMVANHVSKAPAPFTDLIAGKGQGLVILLHGPPGVGKTLTAECIADLYERPLFSVTSGDIGTDPDTVEARLREIFDYAVTWNTVLLLDEADVFLAERNIESLSRNALVSVFLRNLEYFNGIIFLTTNRIGTIDEAFQSRLHVSIGLDPLPKESRRQIWYNFIKDLKHLPKEELLILAREAKDNWCEVNFNGRQIRNCVKTAIVLARQENVNVGIKHFQTVINIGTNFASYMKRLKKLDSERLAEVVGNRLDLSRRPKELDEGDLRSQRQAPKRKLADNTQGSIDNFSPDSDLE